MARRTFGLAVLVASALAGCGIWPEFPDPLSRDGSVADVPRTDALADAATDAATDATTATDVPASPDVVRPADAADAAVVAPDVTDPDAGG